MESPSTAPVNTPLRKGVANVDHVTGSKFSSTLLQIGYRWAHSGSPLQISHWYLVGDQSTRETRVRPTANGEFWAEAKENGDGMRCRRGWRTVRVGGGDGPAKNRNPFSIDNSFQSFILFRCARVLARPTTALPRPPPSTPHGLSTPPPTIVASARDEISARRRAPGPAVDGLKA